MNFKRKIIAASIVLGWGVWGTAVAALPATQEKQSVSQKLDAIEQNAKAIEQQKKTEEQRRVMSVVGLVKEDNKDPLVLSKYKTSIPVYIRNRDGYLGPELIKGIKTSGAVTNTILMSDSKGWWRGIIGPSGEIVFYDKNKVKGDNKAELQIESSSRARFIIETFESKPLFPKTIFGDTEDGYKDVCFIHVYPSVPTYKNENTNSLTIQRGERLIGENATGFFFEGDFLKDMAFVLTHELGHCNLGPSLFLNNKFWTNVGIEDDVAKKLNAAILHLTPQKTKDKVIALMTQKGYLTPDMQKNIFEKDKQNKDGMLMVDDGEVKLENNIMGIKLQHIIFQEIFADTFASLVLYLNNAIDLNDIQHIIDIRAEEAIKIARKGGLPLYHGYIALQDLKDMIENGRFKPEEYFMVQDGKSVLDAEKVVELALLLTQKTYVFVMMAK